MKKQKQQELDLAVLVQLWPDISFLFFFLLSRLIFGNFNFWYLIISVSEEAARAPEARSKGQIKIPTGEE